MSRPNPHPETFSQVTGLGPRFLALLAQKRHARRMAELGDKPAIRGAVAMVAPWALSLAVAAAAVYGVLMLGSGWETKACPPVTARQGAIQYELLTRRCEAMQHGALERLARRD